MKAMKLYLFFIFFSLTQIILSETYLTNSQFDTYTWHSSWTLMGGGGIAHWANHSYGWYLNQNGAGDGLNIDAVEDEAELAHHVWTSNSISTTDLSMYYLGRVPLTWGNDGYNTVCWAEAGDPAFGVNMPLDSLQRNPGGITCIKINSNYELLEVDIIMNGKKTWIIADPNNYDIRDIRGCMTHEVGHTIGLFHPEEFESFLVPLPTMVGYVAAPDDPRTLEEDDRIGVSFLYGGNIITNRTLPRVAGATEISFAWSVNVPTGKTLTLTRSGPRLYVYFATGTNLKIYGALNATYTYFTSLNNWNGLYFYSGSSGNIDDCTFREVTSYGCGAVTIYSASPTIQNCNFEYNHSPSYGISIIANGANSSPYLYNNTFSNSSLLSHGIYIYNATPQLRNNSITISTSTGKAAVYCDYHAAPLFAFSSYPTDGSNNLSGNYYGIYATNGATPCAGQSTFAYWNRILNNTYNAYAKGNSTIYAMKNWWGQYPPQASKIVAESGSYIYYTDPLQEDPLLSQPSKNNSFELNKLTGYDLILEARELRFKGEYKKAFDIYKSILKDKPESDEAIIACIELKCSYYESKDVEIIDFLISLSSDKIYQKELRAAAIEVLSDYYLGLDEKSKATVLISILTDEYANTIHEKNGRMNTFFMHYNSGAFEEAKKEYEIINSKFDVSEATQMAYCLLLQEGVSVSAPRKNNGDELDLMKNNPDELFLCNFPNPFNPSTIINFRIPKAGYVTLKVYDLIGKEVTRLVDDYKSEGKYSIEFNAGDLASGTYFYELRSNEFSSRKKLMLIK